jgi:hypothetical protein
VLAEYVPAEFDENTPKALICSLRSEAKRKKAMQWLRDNLHERVHGTIAVIDENLKKDCSDATLKQLVYAILQIHEFWVIDSQPDFDVEGFVESETLEQYAERIGVPLEEVDLSLDGIDSVPTIADIKPVVTPPVNVVESEPEQAQKLKDGASAVKDTVEEKESIFIPPQPEQEAKTDDLSVSKRQLATSNSKESVEIQELRPDADPVEVRSALGIGKKKCKFIFKGTLQVVANVGRETLPPHLLLRGDAASV